MRSPRAETRYLQLRWNLWQWSDRRPAPDEMTNFGKNSRSTMKQVEVAENTTEEKQLEVASLSYARALLEHSPVGVITYRTSGAAVSANPAAGRILGATPQQLVRQNFRFLRSWQQSGLLAAADEAFRTGQARQREILVTSSFGKERWLQVQMIAFESGTEPHLLVLFSDISEQRQLEEQFRQAQKMEAIGQLAGGVAHDFNNILTGMLCHLGVLRQSAEATVGIREALKEVETEAMRAANLTRQLLLFSRRQAARFELLDLNALILGLLKMLRRVLGENIDVRFTADCATAHLQGDAGMLEQVLMNLCVNARDAMPRGGKLSIRTFLEEMTPNPTSCHPGARPGIYLCLEVTDTGCGMDEKVLKRIFEPFFTTKELGKGTGLGLATVYGIVKQHGGWIEAESKPGQGSIFRVTLPAATNQTPQTKPAHAEPELRGGSETVLLVEDDIALRRMTALCLRKLGYAVLEAGTGSEALKQWENHAGRIDLLLTDMVMAEAMTGLELAERLMRQRPELKVVISSGYSPDLVRPDALPGLNFLVKPYDPATLARCVRKSLGAS